MARGTSSSVTEARTSCTTRGRPGGPLVSTGRCGSEASEFYPHRPDRRPGPADRSTDLRDRSAAGGVLAPAWSVASTRTRSTLANPEPTLSSRRDLRRGDRDAPGPGSRASSARGAASRLGSTPRVCHTAWSWEREARPQSSRRQAVLLRQALVRSSVRGAGPGTHGLRPAAGPPSLVRATRAGSPEVPPQGLPGWLSP